MSWTIKGEAGAALDATVRTLASLNVDSAKLSLTSLDADKFEWSAATTDATGAGTIVPDAGQLVEVFYSGTRRFRGHVTIPRVSTGRVSVTVEGPWWWLMRIPLTQVQTDDTAATAERPSYVFPTQALKTSIEALIDRAIANGVPIIRGTVATMFDFPRVTLTEKSCAQALADLMSICPDAVAYYDYSAASGYPTLNITRRGVMTDTTLTLGTDAIEEIDLSPRLDLEVSQVKIGSVTRNVTTGANTWATQTSGTSVPGKNQIIVTSGPEVNDFLPKDRFDQFEAKSVVMPTTGVLYQDVQTTLTYVAYASVTGTVPDFLLANSPRIQQIIAKHGSTGASIAYGGWHALATTSTGAGQYGTIVGRPELKSKSSTAGLYVVVSADSIPDWAKWENGWTVTDATIEYYAQLIQVNFTIGSTVEPPWYQDALTLADYANLGYVYLSGNWTRYGFIATFKESLPVKLISVSYPTLSTVYRAWDYDYINPPSGLASALLAAQNWIPYEGNIRLVADTVDGVQDLYRKYNLAGALAAHAGMAALPRSVSYDIHRGRKTITLGAPARIDFGTLSSRFRRSPKDNIVYL